MKNWMLPACLAAVTMSVVASAAVPNIFTAGQPASSSQVNQNFQYLDQRTNGAIGTLITTRVPASSDITTSVATATCPANSLVLSASCSCQNVGGTRNFGVLFGCAVSGNAAIVGCFAEAGTFNPNLPPPRGDVTALCLSGLQVDGTPLFTSSAAKASQSSAETQGKENELHQVELDHQSALRARQ